MNEGVPKKELGAVGQFSGNRERNKEKNRIPKGHLSVNLYGINRIIGALKDTPLLKDKKQIQLPDLLADASIADAPSVKEAISEIRKDLLQKAQSPSFRPLIQRFFQEFLMQTKQDDPVLHMPDSNMEAALQALNDRVLFSMIITHGLFHQMRAQEFEEEVKTYRKEYLKNLHRLTQEGMFDIDVASAKNTFDKYGVHLEDYLQLKAINHQGMTAIAPGRTNTMFDVINISSVTTKEQRRHVLAHEMTHAISGRGSVLLSENKESTTDPVSGLVKREGFVFDQRLGLLVNSPLEKAVKYEWLNEAVTESLTLAILSQDPTDAKVGTYVLERTLIQQILSGGNYPISERILYNAYFENYSEGSDVNVSSPVTKGLQEAVDTAYGIPNFLEKIDIYVAKHGIDATIKALRTNPNSI